MSISAKLTIDGKTIDLPADKAWSFSVGNDVAVTPKPPLPSHTFFKGICEYFTAPLSIAPVLKSCGITHMRGWMSIDWNKLPTAADDDVKGLIAWANAGFVTIPCCTTKVPPKSPKQVQDWYATAHALFGKYVGFWEIGNEPNLNTVEAKRSEDDAYWIGTLSSYYDQHLAPACDVLNAKGAITISGGISKDFAALKKLMGFGAAKIVKAAGYHPYGFSKEENIANMRGAAEICGAMPIIATEWNYHAGTLS